MWILYGILPPLIILALIVVGIVALIRGRGNGEGRGIEFSGILLGYTAIAMLVAVFLVASGTGLLLKAGFAEAGNHEFSYDTSTYRYSETSSRSTEVDASDDAIRNDVAGGVTLAFVGAVLLAIHAFGTALLRARKAQGQRLVSRGYNLVGLASATLGFLSMGGVALNELLRRYALGVEDTDPWDEVHPGEPLAFAIVMLPLALWFGWRVWEEFNLDRPEHAAPPRFTPASNASSSSASG